MAAEGQTPNVEPTEGNAGQPVDTGTAANTQTPPAEGSESKWTDEKVDVYVKARIDKQNARHGEDMAEAIDRAEKAERELAAMTLERDRQAVALECGLPLDQIHGNTKEEMQKNAKSLKQYIGTLPIYPVLNGGEGSGKAKPTKEEIMAMKNPRERRAAIAENIELFQ